jgi:hypothetical protein
VAYSVRHKQTHTNKQTHKHSADEIECDRDHDVCFIVTMDMGSASGWWIQMGCGQRHKYALDHLYTANGCTTTIREQTETYYDRDFGGAKRTHTKQVPQKTCVCDTDRCNGKASGVKSRAWLLIAAIVVAVYKRYGVGR